ncbi:hypothetical protein AWENTII_011383 [Aspergillus wentii]
MGLTFVAALAVAVLALFWMGQILSSRRKSLRGECPVPGPKGIPLLGNTFQLSATPQKQMVQWAREFGEVYRVRLAYNDWYMLNSPEAVKEIMDKNSAVTSSRTPMPVASDALSGGMRFLLMPYSPEWRRLRAISHKLLTPKVSDTFQPSQEFEAKQLLHDILTDNLTNAEFYMHIRRYTVSLIMTSTYGQRVPQWECEEVREIYKLMEDFSNVAVPGKYLADTIPPLANILPESLHWWRKSMMPLQRQQEKIWMKFWTSLRTQMETGQAPECFVKQFIESEYEKMGITELQGAFLAGTMIEAGSETTSSALNSGVLYLSAHPDVQSRAHEELDRVVGQSRLPTFADADQLPYIRAIAKEILRVRPVTNMGTPHYTTADVHYKGYCIPKESVVAIQQYAIHNNPQYFPEPEKFKPERYLSYQHKSGVYAASADPHERDHWSFGAGRRICTGMHLAENSLYITVAMILWAFNIRPPPGQKAEQVDFSDEAYLPGMNTLPKRFRAQFIPRTPEIAQLIRTQWGAAKRDGYTLRNVKVDVSGVAID